MCQTKLSDAGGLTPTKERNDVWRKNTPCGADSDYTRQAKATITAIATGFPIIAAYLFFDGLVSERWLALLIELVLLLLGILVTLCVAELVGCENFCGLAAAIFVIFYVSHANSDPLFYALMRAVQTLLGVSIAWLINVKLFPYKGQSSN